MIVVSSIKTLRHKLATARAIGTVGFVPTMGALHDGHLSLMKRAKKECDFLIVSLFVNPLQFGPKEDFKAYPRTASQDRKKARSAEVDLLWLPTEKMLFSPDFQTSIEVGSITHLWEGASRPNHFKGVTTIVGKLLQIVRPDFFYLGQKDYQQCCVIRQMLRDLHFETRLHICPTLREQDGLAMSSRNTRLSAQKREIAPVFYHALQTAKKSVQSGEKKTKNILQAAKSILDATKDIQLDYLALCDTITLLPIDRIKNRAVLLVSGNLGEVRLIDNILLKVPSAPNKS